MPLFEDPDPFDVDGVPRPRSRHDGSWAGRLGDGARPWIEWFGGRRLLALVATVVVAVVGGWWLLRAPAPPTEAGLPFAGPTTVAASALPGSTVVSSRPTGAPPTSGPAAVVVDVAGAVAVPGVYELPPGARTHHAVAAAGGATAEADLAAVNLAAPLADGAQVFIPVVGAPPRAPPAGGASPTGTAAPPGPVELNRATADELDALPGIGPSTAAAIVAHREEHGPFASVDQLLDVRGIGPAKLDAIRDLVVP